MSHSRVAKANNRGRRIGLTLFYCLSLTSLFPLSVTHSNTFLNSHQPINFYKLVETHLIIMGGEEEWKEKFIKNEGHWWALWSTANIDNQNPEGNIPTLMTTLFKDVRLYYQIWDWIEFLLTTCSLKTNKMCVWN